jgi:hypothetical protein
LQGKTDSIFGADKGFICNTAHVTVNVLKILIRPLCIMNWNCEYFLTVKEWDASIKQRTWRKPNHHTGCKKAEWITHQTYKYCIRKRYHIKKKNWSITPTLKSGCTNRIRYKGM